MHSSDSTKQADLQTDRTADDCCHGECACGQPEHTGCQCKGCGSDCDCGDDLDLGGDSSESDQVAELKVAVQAAREAELRSKADYQNLVRRTQDERAKLVKLAALGLVEDLLEPLDHLRLASEHLQDKGLEMVVSQLWQVLENHGLQPMNISNKAFDPHLMEVVEKEGNGEKVKKIVKQGYTLNGDVIRHAKVVVG